MQNLFVALPVPEIIIRYIGILSLHYLHTSVCAALPFDAGISRDHAGVVTGNPSVTCYYNVT